MIFLMIVVYLTQNVLVLYDAPDVAQSRMSRIINGCLNLLTPIEACIRQLISPSLVQAMARR